MSTRKTAAQRRKEQDEVRYAPLRDKLKSGRLRIMGFDAGTVEAGYAVVEHPGDKLVAFGQFAAKSSMSSEERFNALCDWLMNEFVEVSVLGKLDALVIERSYVGEMHGNVNTGIVLGHAIGAARALAWVNLRVTPFLIAHATAKKAFTGSGKATKEGVMLCAMLRYITQDERCTPAAMGVKEHWADAAALCAGLYTALVG